MIKYFTKVTETVILCSEENKKLFSPNRLFVWLGLTTLNCKNFLIVVMGEKRIENYI